MADILQKKKSLEHLQNKNDNVSVKTRQYSEFAETQANTPATVTSGTAVFSVRANTKESAGTDNCVR